MWAGVWVVLALVVGALSGGILPEARAQEPPLDDPKPALPGGKLRTHYLAAEEVQWNYAPAGRDEAMGHDFHDEQKVWVDKGPTSIGAVSKKAVYVEYTDQTFTTRRPRGPEWEHLGLLGPVLRAEVGDVIRVVFKNKASRPYSIHPHGVFYLKDGEGSPTNDATPAAEKRDDAVRPGESHVYVWPVPPRAGPGPNDPSSLVWLYHSHVEEPKDTNAGLVGAMIVSRKGEADAAGRPRGIDREFITLWKVFDESQSHYLGANAEAVGLDLDAIKNDAEKAKEFAEANQKHAINGYIFGSLPPMTMHEGERVRWYMMALGTEVDLHSAHWHGNAVLVDGRRKDVVSLLPADTLVADMVPDNPGIWMLHCHVDDHQVAGMTARYQVLPR
jgi:FtsP/CotA-like multicopper oxidase with cupredoxin domain